MCSIKSQLMCSSYLARIIFFGGVILFCWGFWQIYHSLLEYWTFSENCSWKQHSKHFVTDSLQLGFHSEIHLSCPFSPFRIALYNIFQCISLAWVSISNEPSDRKSCDKNFINHKIYFITVSIWIRQFRNYIIHNIFLSNNNK